MKKRQIEAFAAVAIIVIGFWLAFLITDTTYGSSGGEDYQGVSAIPTRTGQPTDSSLDVPGTQTPSGTPAPYWLFLRSPTARASRTPTLTPTVVYVTPTDRKTKPEDAATPAKKQATRTKAPTRAPTRPPAPTGTEAGTPKPAGTPAGVTSNSTPMPPQGSGYFDEISSRSTLSDFRLPGRLPAYRSSQPPARNESGLSRSCVSYPGSIYCGLIVLLQQLAGG